jgi:hypothetical protein
MTWKRAPEIDQEIRRWMKAKGWEVTRTNYDPERKVESSEVPQALSARAGGRPSSLAEVPLNL